MPGQEFLIRTKAPLMVCQVLKFDNRAEMEDFIREQTAARALVAYAHQYEGTTLTAYIGLLADHDWKDKSDQEIANKMAALVRRMSDWYHHNIMKHEE